MVTGWTTTHSRRPRRLRGAESSGNENGQPPRENETHLENWVRAQKNPKTPIGHSEIQRGTGASFELLAIDKTDPIL